jgi:hypothetical protein
MPICTKCKADRPAGEFPADRRTKSGLAKVCTPCKTPAVPAFAIVYYPKGP